MAGCAGPPLARVVERDRISLRATYEYTPTVAADGSLLLFARYDYGTEQTVLLRSERALGRWAQPHEEPAFRDAHAISFSQDGTRVVYSLERDDQPHEVWLVERTASGFGSPISLTARDGVVGSYFSLLADGTLFLWCYEKDGVADQGDIFRCDLVGGRYGPMRRVPGAVNTPDAGEFSPYVDPKLRYMMFTRVRGDDPAASASFVSMREGDRWGRPRRLSIGCAYGFTASADGQRLLFSLDDDIQTVRFGDLGLPGPRDP